MTTHHRSRVGLQKPFDIWNRMVHCFLFLFFFFTYIYTHPRDASVGIDEIEKKLYITCRWHWPLNISSSKCVLGSILCLRNKLNAWSASLLELPKQWFSKSRCMHRGQRPNWAHSSKKKKKTVHTRADEIPVTSVQDALAVVRSPLGEQQQWEDAPARNGKRVLCPDWPTRSCYPTGRCHRSCASRTTLYTFFSLSLALPLHPVRSQLIKQ